MSIRLDHDLRDLLVELLREFVVPGAAVEITHRGRTRRAVAGAESLRHGRPVGLRSRFALGSASSMLTAAVVLTLLDQRGLDPAGTSLAAVLPELELGQLGLAHRITVLQLLTHTSGLESDHLPDLPVDDYLLDNYVAGCAALGSIHAPGSRFSYCHSGLVLLGAIAERLAGATWPELLSAALLRPLGMADTRLSYQGDKGEDVRGHQVDADSGKVVETSFRYPPSLAPAGLVFTTIGDMTRFLRFLSPGSPGPFARIAGLLNSPGVPIPAGQAGFGIRHWRPGWAEWSLDGLRMLGHDGRFGSQRAVARMIPSEDFTVVVLTNAVDGQSVARELLHCVLGETFGAGLQRSRPGSGSVTKPPREATYVRRGARLTIGYFDAAPVLSLDAMGVSSLLAPEPFQRVPLLDSGHERWTVRVGGQDYEVTFDGAKDGAHDAPRWLYFDGQAHRLAG